MTIARKIMNTNTEILITEEERKAAAALFLNTPTIPVEKVLEEYRVVLNDYCSKFEASSYRELAVRADEFEFGPTISLDILDKCSFIERHLS
jgi:hypothetical protein